MQEEPSKGLLLPIPGNHVHGGLTLSSQPPLCTTHQLNTSFLNNHMVPAPISHHHQQQSHFTQSNFQNFYSNTQAIGLSSAIPHDFSSSEASSLSLNSTHHLHNLNNISEPRQQPQHEKNELETIVNERRVRRLISNRESARRSRMRKRKQLEELQGQVMQLLAANHQLTDKLNQVLECNYRVIQENSQLKEEAASLRMAVTDLITSMEGSHHAAPLIDVEVKEAGEGGEHSSGDEVTRNMAQVRAHHTAAASMDILQ